MQEELLTTADLLEQWREAVRASELAERLAKLAAESASRADQSAKGAEEIARMAERAATAAERAARAARKAAEGAGEFARSNRASSVADADTAVEATKAQEQAARDRYHEAERRARAPQSS